MEKDKLKLLENECKNCKACELAKTRENIVFADGNPNTAKIFLIGEAPGENEDKLGKPFVGRAGKLLDDFLSKAEIVREKDLYIANTIKCRPPKNRVPTQQEKDSCRHFLEDQIRILSPKLILLCGATALNSFCNKKCSISKQRGEIFEIEINQITYKAMAIFHPSYLLRNHSLEKNSPRDLMLSDLKKVKNLFL